MKIISGGQTGVDRAALDAAIEAGIPHGGWCPRGRLAEDGRIPDEYELVETESPDYPARTEQNVLDADATLILHRGPLSGGTVLTLRMAERYGRPSLVVDLDDGLDPADVRSWLEGRSVETLNVAGPRESQNPGIGELAREFLVRVFCKPKSRSLRNRKRIG